MLSIFKQIDVEYNKKEADKLLSNFKHKYAGLSFGNWRWGTLEKWIDTKTDNKQVLQSALDFFKSF